MMVAATMKSAAVAAANNFFEKIHKKLLIFLSYCVIISIGQNNILPCSSNYSFYNPTHLIREFSSVCGLQTSRFRKKGARSIRAFTHLLRAGFIRYMTARRFIFIFFRQQIFAAVFIPVFSLTYFKLCDIIIIIYGECSAVNSNEISIRRHWILILNMLKTVAFVNKRRFLF